MILVVIVGFQTSLMVCLQLFFFFKQKTAYEMRISDWSSDVCSSDLSHQYRIVGPIAVAEQVTTGRGVKRLAAKTEQAGQSIRHRALPKIGRASCRERVCQYV